MRRSISFLIVIPNIILVSTLFWILTSVGQYFYTKEDPSAKKDNFECGFENITIGESQIDFKNSVVLSFLILYDIELLLLLPVSFTMYNSLTYGLYKTISILFVILVTCFLDLELGTLEYDN